MGGEDQGHKSTLSGGSGPEGGRLKLAGYGGLSQESRGKLFWDREGPSFIMQEPQTRQGVSHDLWRVGTQEATRTPVFRASTESALALSDRA